MKYVLRLLKAAIFFTLFAFALNNQHDTTVNFFFGTSWHAPLVLVVLAAFASGLVVGALGMVPGWWKHRRAAAQLPTETSARALGAAGTMPVEPVPTTAASAATSALSVARQHGF